MNTSYLSVKSIFIQLALVIMIILAIIYFQYDFLYDLYLGDNQHKIGKIINIVILFLFILGLLRLISLLNYYKNELMAIEMFSYNYNEGNEIDDSIAQNSLIRRRYTAIEQAKHMKTTINHSALASVSVAEEYSRLGFVKFINNVLILTGVFGTIVSLSIALLGASSMITSTTEISGLGEVIQGMSSALSTTMTAILAYFVFSYFYQCLINVQTRCISHLEFITTTSIAPMFATKSEEVIKDYSLLLESVSEVTNELKIQQQQISESYAQIGANIQQLTQEIKQSHKGFKDIVHLLKEGFRLSGRD